MEHLHTHKEKYRFFKIKIPENGKKNLARNVEPSNRKEAVSNKKRPTLFIFWPKSPWCKSQPFWRNPAKNTWKTAHILSSKFSGVFWGQTRHHAVLWSFGEGDKECHLPLSTLIKLFPIGHSQLQICFQFSQRKQPNPGKKKEFWTKSRMAKRLNERAKTFVVKRLFSTCNTVQTGGKKQQQQQQQQ